MSVSVSVDTPRKLTRETLIFVLGGAGAGLVTSGLTTIAGSDVPALGALAFGGVVGLLANLSDPKVGTPMLRLVLSILGGAAMAALLSVHWALAAAVAGLFFGIAFSLDNDTSTTERAFFGALYALAMVGGVFVSQTLGARMHVPLATHVFSGATWGVFLAFAGGLKRLHWARDEVMAEFKDAHADLRGDERETIRSGKILYEQIVRELDRTTDRSLRDRAVEISTETSRALIAITRRASELRIGAERTGNRQLRARIVELDERIAKARDATVRRELQATLEELVQQVKVRRRFDVARARLEARQQRCFTALERLHVSLVQSTSGADDVAVRESIESLEKLSDEIRWRNLSVDELCEGTEEAEHEVGEAEAEEILTEIRAQMAEQPDEADSEPSGTVLDTGVASEDADSVSEPPGTDGSVAEPAEQHVASDSR